MAADTLENEKWCKGIDGKLSEVSGALVTVVARQADVVKTLDEIKGKMANGDGYHSKCDQHKAAIDSTAVRVDSVETTLKSLSAKAWQIMMLLAALLISQVGAWLWRATGHIR